MYVHAQNSQLGIIPALTGAAGTALNIAQTFGIGRKKGQIQAIPRGTFLQYFPPGVNWNEVLSRSMNHPRLGRKTYREIFQWMLNRNDSWLIKNNVNNPDDYAAFIIYDQLSKGYGCNPKTRNKNSQSYKDCPKYLDNGINIFDVEALEQYALDKEFEARERQIKQQAQIQDRLQEEQKLAQSLANRGPNEMQYITDLKNILSPRVNPQSIDKMAKNYASAQVMAGAEASKLVRNAINNPAMWGGVLKGVLDYIIGNSNVPSHPAIMAVAEQMGYIKKPELVPVQEPVRTQTTPEPAPVQDKQPAAQPPAQVPQLPNVQPTSFMPIQPTTPAPTQQTGFMDNLPPWAIPAGLGALALVLVMGRGGGKK